MKKKIWNAVRACVPIWSAILFGLFFISLVVVFFVKRSSAFAGALHETVGVGIRAFFVLQRRYCGIVLLKKFQAANTDFGGGFLSI